MSTYFVFGKAPAIVDLFDYTGRDEKTERTIKIEEAVDKSGHYLLSINGHMVGAQISNEGIFTAIYEVDSDIEGVRLLGLLIEQWSRENSPDEADVAITVVDDEMSIYLEYV